MVIPGLSSKNAGKRDRSSRFNQKDVNIGLKAQTSKLSLYIYQCKTSLDIQCSDKILHLQ